MTLSAYVNNSEKNAFNKDKTLIATVQGTLKDGTSIIDPVIIVSSLLETVRNCNYIEIPEFNRKYFVNNIKSIRNGLVELSCHVDVLESFKDEILSNRALIRRSENNWNLYLDDGSFKLYSNPNVKQLSFPSGFDGLHYILVVAG